MGAVAASAAALSLLTFTPHAAAQPAGCSDPNQTTAYVDTSWSSHNDGVWVACVPYTDVNHECFASFAKAKKLYRRGEGPAPECRSIYNPPRS